METVRIFRSADVQVVHLPRAFHLDADEVRIRRHGASIVLEPVARDWSWLEDVVGPVDEAFEQAVAAPVEGQVGPDPDFYGL
ncbi:antitoxin [Acidomonas methanolica]|uniref:Regulator of stationary/sporulation SpoVT/AbrB n=1 Tax=Acidomonas methanolica NBRC 104435 TaxID=1231351 RepID=A0A023D6A1_ACIMT|nr:AbrB family transcriptional regulator [Acidomonas methanolica]MBU2655095.1 hypothetical protein [Acidomonas methanolica]TCS29504.1 antitoxin VapB [Acidomonas methanolica]GAJ29346.1 regulator of stationary/sporulation SpoVT/AbrB [Acidomonas methanolica NBRC 104435]GEK99110.1 hypothetical protein AME01nite_16090 [Acidomonas methanolica NBRC 104435]